MKITDKDQLIPDHAVLLKVVQEHPFHDSLDESIDSITVRRPEQAECIQICLDGHDVTLVVYPANAVNDHYLYLLYHEFGHVADRLNPAFNYSEEQRQALKEHKRENFVELWNLYIDARLNDAGLFRLSINSKVFKRIKGKPVIVERTMETELWERANFLSSRGFRDADEVVSYIWQHPRQLYSFNDLVNLIRQHME